MFCVVTGLMYQWSYSMRHERSEAHHSVRTAVRSSFFCICLNQVRNADRPSVPSHDANRASILFRRLSHAVTFRLNSASDERRCLMLDNSADVEDLKLGFCITVSALASAASLLAACCSSHTARARCSMPRYTVVLGSSWSDPNQHIGTKRQQHQPQQVLVGGFSYLVSFVLLWHAGTTSRVCAGWTTNYPPT